MVQINSQFLLGLFSGILVFVIGRWIEKMYIDSIKEFRTVIAEVYDYLIFYSDKICNPIDHNVQDERIVESYRKASEDLRRMSTKLRAATYNIKLYCVYSFVTRAPKKQDIAEACRALIGISNSLFLGRQRGIELDNQKNFIMKKLKLDKFEKNIEP